MERTKNKTKIAARDVPGRKITLNWEWIASISLPFSIQSVILSSRGSTSGYPYYLTLVSLVSVKIHMRS